MLPGLTAPDPLSAALMISPALPGPHSCAAEARPHPCPDRRQLRAGRPNGACPSVSSPGQCALPSRSGILWAVLSGAIAFGDRLRSLVRGTSSSLGDDGRRRAARRADSRGCGRGDSAAEQLTARLMPAAVLVPEALPSPSWVALQPGMRCLRCGSREPNTNSCQLTGN